MDPKSMKNRFKSRSKFQSDFAMVFAPFVINFANILRTFNLQKWCSRVGAVLFLRKSRFSDQIRFWMDIFMIFDGLGDHFGDHFGIKIASKSRLKNQSDFGSILDGFWLPFWAHFDSILVPKIDQKSRSEKGWNAWNYLLYYRKRGSGYLKSHEKSMKNPCQIDARKRHAKSMDNYA